MTQLTRGYRAPQTTTQRSIGSLLRIGLEDRLPGYLSAHPVLRGQERFSFPQIVTLHEGVAMRTRSYWCPELETLSINVLLHAKVEWRSLRSPAAARRVTRFLAEPFAREILAPCAGHAWHLSIEAILEALNYLVPAARVRSRGP